MRIANARLAWGFVLVGVIGLAAYGGTVFATPPAGATSVALAHGTDRSNGTIPLQEGTDIVVSQITIAPGGSSGWHMHPGGAIVVVKQGQITENRAVGRLCESTTYTAGEAFIEPPGVAHDAVNTGTTPYVAFVTYPRVPQGDAARIDLPDPGTCPGL